MHAPERKACACCVLEHALLHTLAQQPDMCARHRPADAVCTHVCVRCCASLRLVRHPGYLGWCVWAVATQLLLANPLCTLLFCFLVSSSRCMLLAVLLHTSLAGGCGAVDAAAVHARINGSRNACMHLARTQARRRTLARMRP